MFLACWDAADPPRPTGTRRPVVCAARSARACPATAAPPPPAAQRRLLQPARALIPTATLLRD
jgi:hypothetical protein